MTDLLDAARARAEARPTPRPIDYARMNRELPRQKAALTRATATGDPERVATACKAAVTAWNEIGAWPDCWHRWQIALDDATGIYARVDLADL